MSSRKRGKPWLFISRTKVGLKKGSKGVQVGVDLAGQGTPVGSPLASRVTSRIDTKGDLKWVTVQASRVRMDDEAARVGQIGDAVAVRVHVRDRERIGDELHVDQVLVADLLRQRLRVEELDRARSGSRSPRSTCRWGPLRRRRPRFPPGTAPARCRCWVSITLTRAALLRAQEGRDEVCGRRARCHAGWRRKTRAPSGVKASSARLLADGDLVHQASRRHVDDRDRAVVAVEGPDLVRIEGVDRHRGGLRVLRRGLGKQRAGRCNQGRQGENSIVLMM